MFVYVSQCGKKCFIIVCVALCTKSVSSCVSVSVVYFQSCLRRSTALHGPVKPLFSTSSYRITNNTVLPQITPLAGLASTKGQDIVYSVVQRFLRHHTGFHGTAF